ncbi:NADH dehydrogenase [ubiquinone] 1 alpha subcomplex subunit 6 [Halotydeus destructor]|nr:NADH dehydrogenase [ubiquinone] 1 alpha subcomplex subunit 6 [Halotydeus destructor]
MASKQLMKHVQGQVKPILSLDKPEAHRRVINLYRAWYRQVPYILHDYHLNLSEKQMKEKLREFFYRNKNVSDIRVIDMLIIKGQMELNETVNKWKQECHVMNWFKPTVNPRPKDFISKFLAGKDSE